jgi:signal transduction histidine kinase
VLLLLCMPLVPTVLLVRLIGQADEMMLADSAARMLPLYRKQFARAGEAAASAGSASEALGTVRALFGSGMMAAVHDANGRLIAGDGDFRGALEVLEHPVEHLEGTWTISLAVEGSDRASGLGDYLLLAGLVTGGVLITAVGAAVTLSRQLKIQEMKTDALNAVSHELKTPLASMRVLIETLQDGRAGDEAAQGEYLSMLMSENQRMGRILSDFLSLARLERNRKTFRMLPVVAAESVRSAVDEARPKVEERGGRIRCYGPKDGPLVVGEGTSLEGVISILLDNAVKYTQTGGVPDIEIAYFKSGRFAYFLIKDRGIGVPREYRRRIFDSFYQVDPKLSRRGGGCGLGLSIAWHIVSAHGGEIRQQARRGRGSIFRFSIPLAPKTATPAPA